MPSRLACILSLLAIVCAGGGVAGPEPAAQGPAPAEIAARAAPSVVGIRGYMGGSGETAYAEASGFFVHEDGFVVTVSNLFTRPTDRRLCERFMLTLLDGRELSARVHSVDASLNLVVLRVTEPGVYPVAEADDRAVRPGDQVIALAGRGSQGETPYTLGTVKARHKTSVYGAGLGDMFIDSYMLLPAGAYGGPLLNETGRVIGINTPNVHRPDSEPGDPEESHALPIRVVKGFFKVSKQFPTSVQMWMGLAFRPLSPEEKTSAYRVLGQSAGVLVEYVWTDGPAGQADVAPGDILVRVNGKELQHLHELDRLLFELKPGSLVDLVFLRRDRGLMRQVRLEKRPDWAGFVNWRFRPSDAAQGPQGAATQVH